MESGSGGRQGVALEVVEVFEVVDDVLLLYERPVEPQEDDAPGGVAVGTAHLVELQSRHGLAWP